MKICMRISFDPGTASERADEFWEGVRVADLVASMIAMPNGASVTIVHLDEEFKIQRVLEPPQAEPVQESVPELDRFTPKEQQILLKKILDEHYISNSAKGALLVHRIDYIYQLWKMQERDLYEINFIGTTGVGQIRLALARYGLGLGGLGTPRQPPGTDDPYARGISGHPQLAPKTQNALSKFRTVGDLLKLTKSEAMKIKYLGPKGLKEVEDLLVQINQLDRWNYKPGAHLEDPEDWYSRNSIENSSLPNRAKLNLMCAGIRSVYDLSRKSEEEVLRIRGFGQGSLEDVRILLAKTKLDLGNRWKSPRSHRLA